MWYKRAEYIVRTAATPLNGILNTANDRVTNRLNNMIHMIESQMPIANISRKQSCIQNSLYRGKI